MPALALVLLVFVAATLPAQTPTPDAAPRPRTLSGETRWIGPEPKVSVVVPHPVLEKTRQGEPLPPRDTLIKKGKLADVLVWISKGLPDDRSWPGPAEPARLTYHRSEILPRVLAFRAGQGLVVENRDPVNVCVHLVSKRNGSWNMTLAAGAEGHQPPEALLRPEIGTIRIKDDCYGFMEAQAHLLDHPFFAVSDENGGFSIDVSALPNGRYVVSALHARWKTRRCTVDLGDEAAVASFSFALKGR